MLFCSTLLGSSILHPSNPYSILIPSNPPALGRRERSLDEKGMWTSLHHFLLIKGVKFPGASPVFVIQISPTSSPAAQQPSNPATQQSNPGIANAAAGPAAGGEAAATTGPLRALSHLHPNGNYLQLAKATPLLEHETIIVSHCGQSEATPHPTPGIKTETDSQRVTEFSRKPNFSLHHLNSVSTLSFRCLCRCTQ